VSCHCNLKCSRVQDGAQQWGTVMTSAMMKHLVAAGARCVAASLRFTHVSKLLAVVLKTLQTGSLMGRFESAGFEAAGCDTAVTSAMLKHLVASGARSVGAAFETQQGSR
jgi:hypothetical protein